ncbi:hypothetical protein [Streptomyces sp. SAS_270]|uniref:hypothetical protein n=1 Tax=Streptomyces sp. SAS_270 TaxID=3412748 RepID=UPI00403C3C96
MTPVRTPAPPPPPPLPVRRGAAAPRGGLAPLLGRLAAERATGVLVRERGTLYLRDGQVVHAESPAAPGLDVLLTARGTLDAEGWREAVDRAGERRAVGRFLVEQGRIGLGALELCHLGALYDAVYFVLGPSGTPAGFRTGAAHWFGPVRPVPVAAVQRETRRRRELLRRIWPDAATDDAPLVRAERRAAPAVTARQRAVLDRLDGVRTAADIARALGRPTFHTLVDLRRLAAAGLVTTAPRPDAAALREEFDASISAQARTALREVSHTAAPTPPARRPSAPTPEPSLPACATGAAPTTPHEAAAAPHPASHPAAPTPPDRRPPAPAPGPAPTAPREDTAAPRATSGLTNAPAPDLPRRAAPSPGRAPTARLTPTAPHEGSAVPRLASRATQPRVPEQRPPALTPRRAPSASTGAAAAVPIDPAVSAAAPPGRVSDDPQVALLRRLRDALEAL